MLIWSVRMAIRSIYTCLSPLSSSVSSPRNPSTSNYYSPRAMPLSVLVTRNCESLQRRAAMEASASMRLHQHHYHCIFSDRSSFCAMRGRCISTAPKSYNYCSYCYHHHPCTNTGAAAAAASPQYPTHLSIQRSTPPTSLSSSQSLLSLRLQRPHVSCYASVSSSSSSSSLSAASSQVEKRSEDESTGGTDGDSVEAGEIGQEAKPKAKVSSNRSGRGSRNVRSAKSSSNKSRGGSKVAESIASVRVEGVVKRITFRSESSGYTVARIDGTTTSNNTSSTGNSNTSIEGSEVVVGDNIQSLSVGQRIVLDGIVTMHARYGRRITVEKWWEQSREKLSDGEGARYLAGLLPGVGIKTAENMIKKFGSVKAVFSLLDEDANSASSRREGVDESNTAALRLVAVPGISHKKAIKMVEKWHETRNVREASSFLQSLGLQTGLSERVALKFGSKTENIVRADPYKALRGIRGITFELVDSVGAKLNIPKSNPSRVLMAMELALIKNAQTLGHTFMYFQDAIQQTLTILNNNKSTRQYVNGKGNENENMPAATHNDKEISGDFVSDIIRQHGSDIIVVEEHRSAISASSSSSSDNNSNHGSNVQYFPRHRVYLTRLYQAECSITNAMLSRIRNSYGSSSSSSPSSSSSSSSSENNGVDATTTMMISSLKGNSKYQPPDINEFLVEAEEKSGVALSDEQKEVLRMASKEKILLLTGGPGSGKTLVTNFIAQYFTKNNTANSLNKSNVQLKLCAPTARAANRLQAITNKEASTIHRLLGYESSEVAGIAAENSGSNSKDPFSSSSSDGVDGVDVRQSLFYNSRNNKSVFKYNRNNKIDADVVIVDESSMIDVVLMESLLNALRDTCRIILVGDADQLPPVGPGSPFKCLLASGVVPTLRLSHIYRQDNDYSLIIDAAHNILKGNVPNMEKVKSTWNGSGEEWPITDCLWVDVDEDINSYNNNGNPGMRDSTRVYMNKYESAATVAQSVKDLITGFIPALGFDVVDDVQVMAPGRRGPAGCVQLNRLLQPLLNVHVGNADKQQQVGGSKKSNTSEFVDIGDEVYHVGDRVMQTLNDYDRDIFNGDQGTVVSIKKDKKVMTVAFPTNAVAPLSNKVSSSSSADLRRMSLNSKNNKNHKNERYIEYTRSQIRDSLMLSWCTTVHKAQGGEFPVIILALSPEQHMLNNRRLLYTGITRAKQLCIVISDASSLATAVMTRGHQERLTWLDARLRFAMRKLDGGDLGDHSGVSGDASAFMFNAAMYKANKNGIINKEKVYPGVSVWQPSECFRIQGYVSEDAYIAVIAVSSSGSICAKATEQSSLEGSNTDADADADADAGEVPDIDILYPCEEQGSGGETNKIIAYVPEMLQDFCEVEGDDDDAVIVLASRDEDMLDARLKTLKETIREASLRKNTNNNSIVANDDVNTNSPSPPLWYHALEKAASENRFLVQPFFMKRA